MRTLTARLVLTLMIALPSAATHADNKHGEGPGKSARGDRQERSDDRRDDPRGGRPSAGQDQRREHFDDRHREFANNYFAQQYRDGHCPPGLARKNNGCLPPGQARKWQVGRPLARDVIYYDVPATLVLQLGRPPAGYRYIRVASDILLMALGTGMIVDAMQDLGRQ